MRGPWCVVIARVRTWWNASHPVLHPRVVMEQRHFWDEVSAWQRPRKPVTCVYCHTLKAVENLRERCPAAPTSKS